jgi:hypothetical protein
MNEWIWLLLLRRLDLKYVKVLYLSDMSVQRTHRVHLAYVVPKKSKFAFVYDILLLDNFPRWGDVTPIKKHHSLKYAPLWKLCDCVPQIYNTCTSILHISTASAWNTAYGRAISLWTAVTSPFAIIFILPASAYPTFMWKDGVLPPFMCSFSRMMKNIVCSFIAPDKITNYECEYV